MEITKAELKKIGEVADFLHGHGFHKAAEEAHALVKRIETRASKVVEAAS